jgi:PAS domain-containing protein
VTSSRGLVLRKRLMIVYLAAAVLPTAVFVYLRRETEMPGWVFDIAAGLVLVLVLIGFFAILGMVRRYERLFTSLKGAARLRPVSSHDNADGLEALQVHIQDVAKDAEDRVRKAEKEVLTLKARYEPLSAEVESLRGVVAALPQPLCLLDEKGEILFANNIAVEQFQVRSGQMNAALLFPSEMLRFLSALSSIAGGDRDAATFESSIDDTPYRISLRVSYRNPVRATALVLMTVDQLTL